MTESLTHQHYVPQFLLRNFGSGRSNQIYVFEKSTQKTFKTSVRNIASVRGFYDFDIAGEARSVDPLLQLLEDATKEIIKQIVQARSLQKISPDERQTLALFVSAQMLRTDAQRRRYKDLNDKIQDAIVKMGGDPNDVDGFQVSNEEESRAQTIAMLPQLARDFAPHFLSKSWLLYTTSHKHAFYISDSPVVMHNTVNQNPYRGTLGLAVPGIEIYLPLSGTLCLGFLCPTIESMIRDGEDRAKRLGAPISFQKWTKAFDGDETLALDPDNVTHHNSLQVINGERYVFSSNGDFALVHEMLRSNPELKNGARYEMA
jgi:Protein of unknown function (DUF4238)